MNKVVVFFCCSLLLFTSHAELEENEKIITAKKREVVKPLYFSSIIQPINTVTVSSPSDGMVSKQYFVYGEEVKKDQTLLILDSASVEKDYHTALAEYLRAKEKFFLDESKYNETKTLFELGIVPRNEFESTQSTFNHSNVAFLQSTYKLNNIMKAAQIDSESIADLDISNFKAIDAALKVRYNCIKITALENGVALAPPKTDESDYFGVGARIKAGEALILIGDMTGLSLSIAVTEIDVREVKVGQKAIISGVAFPELKLVGEVTHVDAQATSSHRSGLPLFPVKIEVKEITDKQRDIIKVGMSAKIRLNVTIPGILEVPIQSVYKKGENTILYKYISGKKVETIVTTGRTTMNTVEIIDGIKEGDQVVVIN